MEELPGKFFVINKYFRYADDYIGNYWYHTCHHFGCDWYVEMQTDSVLAVQLQPFVKDAEVYSIRCIIQTELNIGDGIDVYYTDEETTFTMLGDSEYANPHSSILIPIPGEYEKKTSYGPVMELKIAVIILETKLADDFKKEELVYGSGDISINLLDVIFKVDRMVLSERLRYFAVLFSAQFNDAKSDTIIVKHIDPFDFRNFLQLIFNKTRVSEEKVEGVLRLASMFAADSIVEKCKHFLLKRSAKPPVKLTELAVQYNIDHLSKKAINRCNDIESIKRIMKSRFWDDFKLEDVQLLLQRRVVLSQRLSQGRDTSLYELSQRFQGLG